MSAATAKEALRTDALSPLGAAPSAARLQFWAAWVLTALFVGVLTGALEAILPALHLILRTAALGGAIASHLRIGSPPVMR